MKVKSEREVAQLCPTLHDPMDCSLPGSSVHGIFSKEKNIDKEKRPKKEGKKRKFGGLGERKRGKKLRGHGRRLG